MTTWPPPAPGTHESDLLHVRWPEVAAACVDFWTEREDAVHWSRSNNPERNA